MEVMDWRDGKAIETECERRRRAVDVDPSDGCEVLDAVQWAVSVLREMGAQERYILFSFFLNLILPIFVRFCCGIPCLNSHMEKVFVY